MELAILGLGRMGGNMSVRLMKGGHRVVVWNRSRSKVDAHIAMGMQGTDQLADLPGMLKQSPRVLWFMLPAGQTTDDEMDRVAPLLSPGDIIIDGANSRWTDDKRRAPKFAAMGLKYMDVGVSGGIWGITEGYSQMIGGDPDTFAFCEPIFKTLAPPTGNYGLMGTHGAGHFVKMVHNGIEYGMMQAYGEGYEILRHSEYSPDLLKVSQVWQAGSVVRSWLLDLAVDAFRKHGNDLAAIKDFVADSGEGRWTVEAAIAEDVPAPVITLSLLMRLASRQNESFSAQVLAALRNEFGGHPMKTA
ncbi:MAG: decarboxylating 6-phosphogluconate dehydrogenase [Anaerolineae bacterium]|nr:decarboxylating 6-phosphogluconate dehydrogenase [Anaerolineae bacterium]